MATCWRCILNKEGALTPQAPQESDSPLAVVVRQVRGSDGLALTLIEKRCFPSDSWHPEDFLNQDCLVAEMETGFIAGYLVSHEICPPIAGSVAEREILNLAVDIPYRRKGIAGRLLAAELARGGVHFLEVRESNRSAQMLYSKFGFREIARRSEYYRSPVEAAIVMRSYPGL